MSDHWRNNVEIRAGDDKTYQLEQRIIALEKDNKALCALLSETIKLTNHHYEMIAGILDVLKDMTK